MNPLITICVITYRNGNIILDTLDSIRNQTYKNLELIVADDGSNDDTVFIVENWLENNKQYFIKTSFITGKKNAGVTINCNRAVKKSSGQYVKIIADDILYPTYIEKCVKYFETNPNCNILFSKMGLKLPYEGYPFIQGEYNYDFLKLDADIQSKYISDYANVPLLPTPAVMYRTEFVKKYGYFDERIPMWEDGPFYFKLLEHKEKMDLLDEELVLYRVLEKSLSNGLPISLQISSALFYNLYMYKYEKDKIPFKSLLKKIRNSLFIIFPFIKILSPCYKRTKILK